MTLHAQIQAPLATGDALKQALEQFNPANSLSGFTASPPQAALNPDGLKRHGLDAMRQNETASGIYANEKNRTKIIQNPESPYLQYASRLIDSSESVNEGGCVAQPPLCSTSTSLKTCEEWAYYKTTVCKNTLHVVVNKRVHSIRRYLRYNQHSPINLADCAGGMSCTVANEVHVSADCHGVEVETKYNGSVVKTNHDQTCTNLMLNITQRYSHDRWVDVTVTESILEDRWDKRACSAIAQQGASCVFEQGQECIDANATKIIEGIPITRPCWGSRYQYQCFSHSENTCQAYINQGCIQTMSTCVRQDFGVCVQFSQTFECAHTTCVSEPDVCMPALPCTDGSCDTTQNEESHDLGQSASRLGALGGVASDVFTNQINSGVARIFAGSPMNCEKYPLGVRDCCKDSGWGDWVLHCPKEMQDLQKAKADNRVVYVGEYDDGLFDSVTHYVYCIFPTTLSSIVQIQGRGAQLHIPFGSPKAPDCRGIRPEELEHIQFDQLNLSPLEQEFMAYLNPPERGGVTTANQTHIEQLNQLGKPYD
jgi:conjugal transfer mating pair stabilization protein TraN